MNDREKSQETDENASLLPAPTPPLPKEIGGRGGLEPTRYHDWEIDGKCVDF